MFNWIKNKLSPAEKTSPRAIAARDDLQSTAPSTLTDSEAYKVRGNAYLREGKVNEAAQCYLQAASINPDQADVHVNLGFVYREQKRYADAERHLKQAISLDPLIADTYYILGSLYGDQGKQDAAIKNFNTALHYQPKFEAVYHDLSFLLFQAGKVDDAITLMQDALSLFPGSADFHFYLGNLYIHERAADKAIGSFMKTLALYPDHVEARHNLGKAYAEQGRLDNAIDCYQKVLALQPDNVEVLNNLGNLFTQSGRHEEAVSCYRNALEFQSDNADIQINLGIALKARGEFDEAIACYDVVLKSQPDRADAHYHLGGAFRNQGRLEDALVSYKKALALRPAYAEALIDLGNVYSDLGKRDKAAQCYRKALAVTPDYAIAHYNLGKILKDQGKLDEAMASFRAALLADPNYVEAHTNLGSVFQDSGKLNEAVACFRRALALRPDFFEAHNNLGTALQAQGRLDEAIEHYRAALASKPLHAEAHLNLGSALLDQGEFEAAIASSRHAIALKADLPEAYSNLLFALSFHRASTPAQYLAEAHRYGTSVASRAKPYPPRSADTEARGHRVQRVGLVSGDFRIHPVGYFLESVLTHLNPGRIALVAYPTNRLEDALTNRIKPYFNAWTSIAGLDDEAAAAQIHADRIDILIDLAGHTAHNRLPVFAWKPAPVQVSWIGYFASTGIHEIDYLLADLISVPDAHLEHFTEAVWRLPDTRLCFTAPDSDVQVTPPPALANGFITFGCFQNVNKINDSVLALWGRIFLARPDARLRLQNKQMNAPGSRAALLRRLAYVGIAPDRVTISGSIPREEYLTAHAEVDIILDTFPYPGGTTTCEALWMGVPTVTLAGETLLACQGASLLTCARLADWIAADTDAYVEQALSRASNLDHLTRLREELRGQVLASPLFDASRFALNLEDALYGMWQQKMVPASLDHQVAAGSV